VIELARDSEVPRWLAHCFASGRGRLRPPDTVFDTIERIINEHKDRCWRYSFVSHRADRARGRRLISLHGRFRVPRPDDCRRWRTGAHVRPRVGIRPQPEYIADDVAIRALTHAFADAANRRDVVAFESLWDDDCVWEIGAPLPSSATGPANAAALLGKLWEPLEFFVHQVHSGVVVIDEDRATARWTVQETGRRRDGGPYNNHAFYEDELVKREGTWRFARRSYRYLWVDLKTPIGGDAIT
jgi:ketosteroid isomerase-like protein